MYVVRPVTSLHPSSVLRGTITILCMIVAVTGAHGVVTYILVHKSTIRNCWTGWRGGIILHPLCTSVDGSHYNSVYNCCNLLHHMVRGCLSWSGKSWIGSRGAIIVHPLCTNVMYMHAKEVQFYYLH